MVTHTFFHHLSPPPPPFSFRASSLMFLKSLTRLPKSLPPSLLGVALLLRESIYRFQRVACILSVSRIRMVSRFWGKWAITSPVGSGRLGRLYRVEDTEKGLAKGSRFGCIASWPGARIGED